MKVSSEKHNRCAAELYSNNKNRFSVNLKSSFTARTGTRVHVRAFGSCRPLTELRVIGDAIALRVQKPPHLVIDARFPPNGRI